MKTIVFFKLVYIAKAGRVTLEKCQDVPVPT